MVIDFERFECHQDNAFKDDYPLKSDNFGKVPFHIFLSSKEENA
jgi:hypothetical protein